MYEFIGQLFPSGVRHHFQKLMDYSEMTLNVKKLLGFMVVFGVLFAVAGGLYANILFGWDRLVIGVMILTLFEFVIYMWLSFSADTKGNSVESCLPDALQLMAANVRAGFTPDKAFLLSARPEFGPLENEIKLVGKRTLSGVPVEVSLLGMVKRVKSDALARTVELIVEGLRAGGQLADLLDETSDDLRAQELMKKEVHANVLMYAIFILVSVGFGAPLLFAISTYLATVLYQFVSLFATVDLPTGTIPMALGVSKVKPEFVFDFALMSLALSSISGSLIIAMIQKGKEKEGVKYIPLLLLLSLGMFFIARFIIITVFGDLMLI